MIMPPKTYPSTQNTLLNSAAEQIQRLTYLAMPSANAEKCHSLILPDETSNRISQDRSACSSWHIIGTKVTDLGDNYVPRKYDVLCSRGKEAWNHYGNVYFRKVVHLNAERYNKAKSRLERTILVSEVVEYIRSRGTGFVKQEPNSSNWIEVGDELAREKVGQMMRNILGNFRSSLKSKAAKRKVKSSKLSEKAHNVMASHVLIRKKIQELTKACNTTVVKMSDADALQLLTRQNLSLLSIIKGDSKLRAQFLATEAAIQNRRPLDSDSKGEPPTVLLEGRLPLKKRTSHGAKSVSREE